MGLSRHQVGERTLVAEHAPQEIGGRPGHLGPALRLERGDAVALGRGEARQQQAVAVGAAGGQALQVFGLDGEVDRGAPRLDVGRATPASWPIRSRCRRRAVPGRGRSARASARLCAWRP